MTKHLDCVIEGCTAAIDGETEDDVMEQARAHASEAHPELELDEEAAASIRASIRDV